MSKLLEEALVEAVFAYRKAGLDVIPDDPIKKYPVGYSGWETKDFTEAELKDCILNKGYGIGIRNQEILDFDNHAGEARETIGAWQKLVESISPGLVEKLTIESTQNNGYHVGWKCEVIEGNQKLANRFPTEEELKKDPKTKAVSFIETRGQGGQFVAAPTPGYTLLKGDWCNLPQITPEERSILLRCAKSLDLMPATTEDFKASGNSFDGDRPGDLFNKQGADEALELLKKDGWATVFEQSNTIYLRRPGKDTGISASFGYVAPGILYNFTSSGSPFEPNKAYTPFAIFSLLKHNGDFSSAALELAKRYGLNSSSEPEKKLPWPQPLNEAAFHGVLGRLVKLVEPETEADPSAVLIGSLVAFGSIIGRGAYLEIGPMRHHLNLFNATVGHTAKARKGVASAEVRRFFAGIDLDWEKKCKKPSCSTGEGIIHHIRDRVVKLDDSGQEKTVDVGVDDKRLFIDGDELAATLQTMSRSGNTLSSILRLAYDGQDLSTLTKNNSEKASSPHIAISANITEIELKRLLTEVDLNNGLANRFLFTAARRARELPLGGNVMVLELDKLKSELANSVVFARTVGQITFDSQTQDAWIHIYHELTSEIPGLVGVLAARTEPHTLRVAAIYAAADRSNKIKIPHLRAACAVVDYTTETLFYLFGNSTGDSLAEKIIEVLNTKLAGMSRTDIFIFFGKNIPSEQIGVSLEMLEKSGRIRSQTVETDGRPKTIFTLNTFNTSTSPKKNYLESLDEFVNQRGFNTTTQAQNNPENINVKNVINVLSSNEGGKESGVNPEEEVKNPLNTLPGLEKYGK